MRGSSAFRAAIAPGGVLAGPWVKNELWRRAKAVPSLDLRFADNKSLVDAVTGQSLITFTRASSGMSTGSNGLINTATTNLLLRSQELATSPWFNANVTLTNNTGDTLDPVGGSTATKIASSGTGAIGQAAVISTVSTGSIWLRTLSGTLNMSLIVYLSNSPFTNIGTANITVTTNWQRFSVTTTNPPSAASYNFQLNGIPAGTLYAWGAQLEQSSTVGEYIPTTSTINSAPRFDHNPTTGECLGLLMEEQRTNLVTYSGCNANWSADFSAVYNLGLSALGIFSGVQVNSGGQIWHTIFRAGINLTGSTTYAFTAFYRAGTSGRARIVLRNNTLSTETVLAGPVGSLSTVSAVAGSVTVLSQYRWGDGLTYVVTGTFTPSNTSTDYWFRIGPDSATAGQTVIALGAQLEAGAFPTSYIPTTTATVTRSADVASISGSNFSSWYRQDEGTVFAEFQTAVQDAANNRGVTAVDDGTNNNRVSLFIPAGNFPLAVASRVVSGGVASNPTNTGSITSSSIAKSVICYRVGTDGAAVSVNGAIPAASSPASAPNGVNNLRIGTIFGTNNLGGTIKRLVFWPRRLGNEVLQEVTR